jgi:hypothetical protein
VPTAVRSSDETHLLTSCCSCASAPAPPPKPAIEGKVFHNPDGYLLDYAPEGDLSEFLSAESPKWPADGKAMILKCLAMKGHEEVRPFIESPSENSNEYEWLDTVGTYPTLNDPKGCELAKEITFLYVSYPLSGRKCPTIGYI